MVEQRIAEVLVVRIAVVVDIGVLVARIVVVVGIVVVMECMVCSSYVYFELKKIMIFSQKKFFQCGFQ